MRTESVPEFSPPKHLMYKSYGVGSFFGKTLETKEDDSANNSKHLLVSYHKLSLGRKVEQNKKDGYSPDGKRTGRSTAPVGITNKRKAIKPANIPPPEDYFHLLYDEKRKKFDYEEFDGTYEHYSDK